MIKLHPCTTSVGWQFIVDGKLTRLDTSQMYPRTFQMSTPNMSGLLVISTVLVLTVLTFHSGITVRESEYSITTHGKKLDRLWVLSYTGRHTCVTVDVYGWING